VIVEFIDAHREEHGVEPICAQLQIGPSTHYAHRSRPPSARSVADAATTAVIERVHAHNYGVNGVEHLRTPVARRGRPHTGRHGRPEGRGTRRSCGLAGTDKRLTSGFAFP
jgi:putative transposase